MPPGRVFVVGPYTPNGGTHMAYHAARIIQESFGYAAIAVTVADETPAHGMFRYDSVFPSVTIDELERSITADDLLFANAGHSRFAFGPRLPGRKLMYVQHFTTPRPLDRNYDAYIAVSGFVQRFLKNVYDVAAPIIPAFVQIDDVPALAEWDDRAPGSILLHHKGHTGDLAALTRAVAERDPGIDLSSSLPYLAHSQLKATLGAVRYLISVAPAEGFGLVPLEAMAVGTTVVGFDGYGGREYMRDGINCACTHHGDFRGLSQRVVTTVRDPESSKRLADAGRRTAARFDYRAFRERWIDEVARFLELP